MNQMKLSEMAEVAKAVAQDEEWGDDLSMRVDKFTDTSFTMFLFHVDDASDWQSATIVFHTDKHHEFSITCNDSDVVVKVAEAVSAIIKAVKQKQETKRNSKQVTAMLTALVAGTVPAARTFGALCLQKPEENRFLDFTVEGETVSAIYSLDDVKIIAYVDGDAVALLKVAGSRVSFDLKGWSASVAMTGVNDSHVPMTNAMKGAARVMKYLTDLYSTFLMSCETIKE